jgi:hypothetical protein
MAFGDVHGPVGSAGAAFSEIVVVVAVSTGFNASGSSSGVKARATIGSATARAMPPATTLIFFHMMAILSFAYP